MSEDEDNPQAQNVLGNEVDETPLGALFKAVDQVEQIRRVLIIFEKNDGTYGSEDSGILTNEAIYMVECYKHWVMDSVFRPKDKD